MPVAMTISYSIPLRFSKHIFKELFLQPFDYLIHFFCCLTKAEKALGSFFLTKFVAYLSFD